MEEENDPDQKIPIERVERWMPTIWTGAKGTKGTSSSHRVWFELCSVLRAAALTVGDCDSSAEELYINPLPVKEGVVSSEFQQQFEI